MVPAKKGKRPRVKAFGAFKPAIEEINLRISRIIKFDGRSTLQRITPQQARAAFLAYKGTCAYCGIPLNVRNRTGWNSLHFTFYVPIKLQGKKIRPELLLPVCEAHLKNSIKPGLREDIPDLNTFSDLIVVLIKSIVSENELSSELKILMQEKINRIKRLLNFKLEDIALSMRYKPFRDWNPEEFELVVEGDNSFPDLVQKVTEEVIDKGTEETKEEVTECIKQILTAKQYKVVRKE